MSANFPLRSVVLLTAAVLLLCAGVAFAQVPGTPTVDDWNSRALAAAVVTLLVVAFFEARHIATLYARIDAIQNERLAEERARTKEAREDRTEAMGVVKLVLGDGLSAVTSSLKTLAAKE